MKRLLLIISLLAIAAAGTRAQSIGPATINATGGSGAIGSGIFDWSVGEMAMVSTLTAGSVIVTQGLLQTYDVTTGVADYAISPQPSVFPNPASTVVNIQYAATGGETISYRLIDMAGKQLISHSAPAKAGEVYEQVNIESLATASYMLEVTINTASGKTEKVSYKIQKLR